MNWQAASSKVGQAAPGELEGGAQSNPSDRLPVMLYSSCTLKLHDGVYTSISEEGRFILLSVLLVPNLFMCSLREGYSSWPNSWGFESWTQKKEILS